MKPVQIVVYNGTSGGTSEMGPTVSAAGSNCILSNIRPQRENANGPRNLTLQSSYSNSFNFPMLTFFYGETKPRSPQCRLLSQTCSMNMSGKNISWLRGLIKRFFFPMNMSGKIFDTMGVPGGGYISQTCSSKNTKNFYTPFFFNWVWCG